MQANLFASILNKSGVQMKTLVQALMLTLLFPISSFAADVKVVQSEGEVYLGEETTPAEAKALALNNARRKALEETVGIEVHGASVVYNFQLINDLVVAATKGLIVKERIIENNCGTKDKQLFCTARIEAHVKPLSTERKGNLTITKASVQRPDKEGVVKSPVFQKNDEIQVKVSVGEDSYASIFSVDQNGNINKLYPNEYCHQLPLTPGKELVFPDEAQRSSGLKLRVSTPKGKKKAVESVLVIASKEKINFLSDKAVENPTITDLMSELSEIDPSFWAQKTIGYEVRE